MFDHVVPGVTDLPAALEFYETLITALGGERSHPAGDGVEWEDFCLSPAADGRAATSGLHLAFGAGSRADVDRVWGEMVAAGFAADGDPGPRPDYGASYYGGFLRDPDGNSAEIVHRDDVRRDGDVDHLWIRVADADASRAFYDTIADATGLRAAGFEEGAYAHYTGGGGRGALRLLAGEPVTTPLHIAFPAPDRAAVDRFHEAAVAAGYRDNGAPGERRAYHPGYYAAFVLDPDGHNIEAVFHGDA